MSEGVLVAMRSRAADAPHHDHIAEVLGINARVGFLASAMLEHVIVSLGPLREHVVVRAVACVLLESFLYSVLHWVKSLFEFPNFLRCNVEVAPFFWIVFICKNMPCIF